MKSQTRYNKTKTTTTFKFSQVSYSYSRRYAKNDGDARHIFFLPFKLLDRGNWLRDSVFRKSLFLLRHRRIWRHLHMSDLSGLANFPSVRMCKIEHREGTENLATIRLWLGDMADKMRGMVKIALPPPFTRWLRNRVTVIREYLCTVDRSYPAYVFPS